MSHDDRWRIAHALVVVVVTTLVFAGSLGGAFVSDDLSGVQGNRLLESLSAANVAAIFRSFDGANWIPVTVLSLAIDRSIWGPEPFGHHVTNVLLHAGCALLVYAIVRRLGLVRLAALLTALVWALHPLQVESVAWISERKNVLSGLCFFAAFLAYLDFSERPRPSRYVAFLGLYALALLSKMNTMVLPAVCLAFELTFHRRLRSRDVLAMLPPLVLAALVGWHNLTDNPIHGDVWWGGSRIVTWLSTSVVVFRYLGNVLLPVGLRPNYDVLLRGSALEPAVLLALIGLAAIAAVTVLLVVRRRREAFWILWFGITLAPMLNLLVPFRSLMNDRYMYLALLGPIALVASALEALPSVAMRRAATFAGVVAAVASAILSVRQIAVWSDPFTLWAAVADAPLVAADPVYRSPDHDARVAHLQRELTEHPATGALHNNLGALLYGAGQVPDALVELEEANRLTPGDPTVLLNYGRALVRNGRPDAGGAALARAVELRPYDFLSHLQLLRYQLFVARDAVGAHGTLDAALRIRPDERTRAGLAREIDALTRLEAERAGRL